MVKSKSIFSSNTVLTKKYDMDETDEDEKEESEANDRGSEPNKNNNL